MRLTLKFSHYEVRELILNIGYLWLTIKRGLKYYLSTFTYIKSTRTSLVLQEPKLS